MRRFTTSLLLLLHNLNIGVGEDFSFYSNEPNYFLLKVLENLGVPIASKIIDDEITKPIENSTIFLKSECSSLQYSDLSKTKSWEIFLSYTIEVLNMYRWGMHYSANDTKLCIRNEKLYLYFPSLNRLFIHFQGIPLETPEEISPILFHPFDQMVLTLLKSARSLSFSPRFLKTRDFVHLALGEEEERIENWGEEVHKRLLQPLHPWHTVLSIYNHLVSHFAYSNPAMHQKLSLLWRSVRKWSHNSLYTPPTPFAAKEEEWQSFDLPLHFNASDGDSFESSLDSKDPTLQFERLATHQRPLLPVPERDGGIEERRDVERDKISGKKLLMRRSAVSSVRERAIYRGSRGKMERVDAKTKVGGKERYFLREGKRKGTLLLSFLPVRSLVEKEREEVHMKSLNFRRKILDTCKKLRHVPEMNFACHNRGLVLSIEEWERRESHGHRGKSIDEWMIKELIASVRLNFTQSIAAFFAKATEYESYDDFYLVVEEEEEELDFLTERDGEKEERKDREREKERLKNEINDVAALSTLLYKYLILQLENMDQGTMNSYLRAMHKENLEKLWAIAVHNCSRLRGRGYSISINAYLGELEASEGKMGEVSDERRGEVSTNDCDLSNGMGLREECTSFNGSPAFQNLLLEADYSEVFLSKDMSNEDFVREESRGEKKEKRNDWLHVCDMDVFFEREGYLHEAHQYMKRVYYMGEKTSLAFPSRASSQLYDNIVREYFVSSEAESDILDFLFEYSASRLMNFPSSFSGSL